MTANAMQWLQLIVLCVGLISVFVQIGNKQGKQEEMNRFFEKNQDSQDKRISAIEGDIKDIKENISFIKGTLERR